MVIGLFAPPIMKRTFTVQFGSFEARLLTDESDNWGAELLELLDFIEENKESFEVLPVGREADISYVVGNEETKSDNSRDERSGPSDDHDVSLADGPLSPIAKELGVPESNLEEIIYLEEDSEAPLLMIDDKSILGDRKTDRQRRASLILLYAWEKCLGVERVRSTELKDALALSVVNEQNIGNMYQGEGDRYFNRQGRGPSASVALTPPGQRAARKELMNVLEKAGVDD